MYQTNKNEKQSHCLICFASLYEKTSLGSLLALNDKICDNCLSKFKKINKRMLVDGIETLFLYEYNSMLKNIIYQYKGCYDIVLKNVFLIEHKNYINKKFKDYTIIYPPSNDFENEKRGFNHIEEIVKTLNLEYMDIFYKSVEHKQSNLKFNQRERVKDVIKLKENTYLKQKKYLIIDDIYTSGSTLKCIINILLLNGIKKENIKALIISKTADIVELC